MNKSIIILLIIILCVIMFIYFFGTQAKNDAICVRSELDHKKYLVLNLENSDEAAFILSIVRERILILKKYLHENINRYPEYKLYIKQFCHQISKLVLIENAPGGKFTSYTVNKGDKMALCLRSKITKKLHDINLIMYVVLHELAHIACPEVDHTELFKKIFRFFLRIAQMLKIYKNVDYNIDPHEYCGLTINENLFDNIY